MGEVIQTTDPLDYHITFPLSCTSSPCKIKRNVSSKMPDHQYHHHDEFVIIYEDDKRPVVILLGWAGCQDKYLAKYSAIYEEKSYITLRYIAPVECLFWRRDKLPNIAKQLLEVISDKSLDQHPIFFHIFSNGGAFLYQHISLAMEQAKNPLQVKGVIFDSAPGQRRLTSLYRAISAIIGGNLLKNIPMSCVITAFVAMLWIYEIISRAWGKSQLTPGDVISLSEEPHSWPQLFLYSNADTLIPAVDIEKFANRRAERGVNVQLVLFTDSPHVKLYAMYPDVYINTVRNFIHGCLMNTTDDNAMKSAALLPVQIIKKKYELSASNSIENDATRELHLINDS
ncbi:hypothetical protein PV326_011583 [Microctonus aethiopoides]|uniref:Transmembrane protein 53 n=1 Tax=Microctonus aethiopoides TaxID=144406 RepID=A0AA39C4Y0_9HYME|nr:hypothetical protein PV326_011583 [Microctonus aethiopoides]KAK0157991.1 hypothetical protein PV328_011660 [Microctonus aethiopoides]